MSITVADLARGQVWQTEVGNEFEIVSVVPSRFTSKVRVRKLGPLPLWDDGLYIFVPELFGAMTLINPPMGGK